MSLLLFNSCRSIVVDLPPNEKLDDLASLLQIDSKNLDVRQLGLDAIKEQQKINLKFSSNKTAVLPEDKIQVMLTGVSLSYAFECVLQPIKLQFYIRTSYCGNLSHSPFSPCSYSSIQECLKCKPIIFDVTLFVFKMPPSVVLQLQIS